MIMGILDTTIDNLISKEILNNYIINSNNEFSKMIKESELLNEKFKEMEIKYIIKKSNTSPNLSKVVTNFYYSLFVSTIHLINLYNDMKVETSDLAEKYKELIQFEVNNNNNNNNNNGNLIFKKFIDMKRELYSEESKSSLLLSKKFYESSKNNSKNVEEERFLYESDEDNQLRKINEELRKYYLKKAEHFSNLEEINLSFINLF